MQFTIKNKTGENLNQMMRRAGYHSMSQNGTSYIRSLDQGFYPRFHLYLKENEGQIVFNLHLDQRRPRYQGAAHAHNADYEGKRIEEEAERIKSYFNL